MTDTVGGTSAGTGASRDVSAMLMPELRRVAGGLGIKSAGMKKADLLAAVRGAQGGAPSGGQSPGGRGARSERPGDADATAPVDPGPDGAEVAPTPGADQSEPQVQRPRRGRSRSGGQQPDQQGAAEAPAQSEARSAAKTEAKPDASPKDEKGKQGDTSASGPGSGSGSSERQGRQNAPQQEEPKQKRSGQDDQSSKSQSGGNQSGQSAQSSQSGQSGSDQGDDEGGTRRNRRRRGRERQQPTGSSSSGTSSSGSGASTSSNSGGNSSGGGGRHNNRNEPDTTILDDDVLLPCAGILDVLDNYAFVRTSGYLPGPDDVYVSLSMVRKLGLRPGDAISGQVRLPREGERKEKFNPLVKIDSVNGADPELGRSRKEFGSLTPLYPTDRLRMETRPDELVGRLLDVAAPIGKGQRGLVVSPARAGRTTVLRAIADAISVNNPECHLMVVLIDARPEEVTDFERSVKGEVISSTFDRPPADHTAVAELAIERAKRLVELEHDVVVLLDGVTTLGRAYNLAAAPSGRTLDGGVDASALYPPKKFFGAARNIENGGSLTIVATASVESGSAMDEVIFEEFQGTSTMELRLRRDLADRWLFPAVDVVRSGTRREELLMGEEEVQIVRKLRRALSSVESQRGLETVLARMGRTRTNYEFLSQVQRAGDGELTAG